MLVLIIVFVFWLILSIVIADNAQIRGRSFGGYFALSFFLTPILALIILLIYGETEEIKKEKLIQYMNLEYSYMKQKQGVLKKCPFCSEEVKEDANICKYCKSNILEYELELKAKEEKAKKEKEQKIREMNEYIANFFNDEIFIKEAKEIRRIYGKNVYVSYLRNKAKERGLGEIILDESYID